MLCSIIVPTKPISKTGVCIPLAFLAVALVVRPWGNYPLNDDWQYARVVKHLAETGRVLVDVDVAPSLVGQAYLGALVVRLFGFSHLALRILTITVAAALVWTIDRLLRLARVAAPVRALAAVLLILNPIVLHLTFSFMTEIYGYALAMLAVLVWINGRSAHLDDGRLVDWRTGFAAATLAGASFWLRQFCVAVFPAVVAASVWHLYWQRGRQSVRGALSDVAAWTGWFAAIIAAYFVWANATGNYRSAFGGVIWGLLYPRPRLTVLSAYELSAYLTIFLLPFLAFERWRRIDIRRFLVAAAALVVAIAVAHAIQAHESITLHHHLRFPFSTNVVYDTGVGPITFTTTYWNLAAPRPRWPPGVWAGIEWVIVGAIVLWTGAIAATSVGRPRLPPLTAEVRTFGVVFAALSFLLYVQAYEWLVIDRYYVPCLIGALIALSARTAGRPVPRRAWLALVAVAPMGVFGIAGLHDYFRWNDARWQAVRLAEADGATPQILDGGFEVNGWLNYDDAIQQVPPHGCRGTCGCAPVAFYCTDDTYLISMELPPGRTAVATLPVDWWLAKGPPVIVTRR
jgi:hypothetical protein